MRALVSGGSGFIGTRLVELLLQRGNDVRIFDRRVSSKYPELGVLGDVRDSQAVLAAADGCDAIYHLAAEHADNVNPVGLYEEVNVGGARNIADAARAANIRTIVFTSTVAVYSLNSATPAEDHELRPFNAYGRSKLAAEKVLRQWAAESEQHRLTIIRPSVVLGEGNRGNVFNLLRQVHRRRFVMVGNGKNRKSMAYVGNVATFLEASLGLDSGIHVFNYADKPDMTTWEVVNVAKAEFGQAIARTWSIPYALGLTAGYILDGVAFVCRKKFSVSAIRIKKFCADTTVSTAKVERSGFKAPYTLEDGLRRTIAAEFPVPADRSC